MSRSSAGRVGAVHHGGAARGAMTPATRTTHSIEQGHVMNVNRYGSTDQASYPRAAMPPPDVATALARTMPRIHSPAGTPHAPPGNAAGRRPQEEPDGRHSRDSVSANGTRVHDSRDTDGRHTRDSLNVNGTRAHDIWDTDGNHTRDSVNANGTRAHDLWDTDGNHTRDSVSANGTRAHDSWDTDDRHTRDSVSANGTRVHDSWDTDGNHTRDSVNANGERTHDIWNADGEHIHERAEESGKHVRDRWSSSGDHIRDTWDEDGNHIRDIWDANGKHKRIVWHETAGNTPSPIDAGGPAPGPASDGGSPRPHPTAGGAPTPTPTPAPTPIPMPMPTPMPMPAPRPGNGSDNSPPPEPRGGANGDGGRPAGPAEDGARQPFAPASGGQFAAPDNDGSAPPPGPTGNAPAPGPAVAGDLLAPDHNTGATNYDQPSPGAARDPALIGFTPEQGGIVTGAYRHVKRMIDSALGTLESGHPDGSFARWFGSPTQRNVQKVEQVLTHMQHAMSHDQFTFVLGAPHDNLELAHVQASSPHQINLKPLFFNHAFGANTPEATIAHELSHFPYIGNTKDHMYGPGAVANLAARNSDIATDNAENYGMFIRAQSAA